RNKRPVPADTAMENFLTEPNSTDQLSQSETDMTTQHGKDAKRNKAQIDVEDGADLVTETPEDRVSDQTSSQTVQGHKTVPTGKSHFY
ncbi:hypothetical protein M9458_047994, partial [Cirrhinus mrigala]